MVLFEQSDYFIDLGLADISMHDKSAHSSIEIVDLHALLSQISTQLWTIDQTICYFEPNHVSFNPNNNLHPAQLHQFLSQQSRHLVIFHQITSYIL